ncbi:NAD(P)-dependent dehydrogenase (short-subunit alcohol dehydrogenase family) [Paraburkholderia sp. HC6.4b]|uniref:SDR family NAD(P)-dependent oxidoreductase n=1 Tax=unclassified Paraburkholderia TaxID=2615204 RepID=UPI001608E6E9|nr:MULTISPECIES: SDR family NAD(P)-dependent oxidoreductase [unclassified Paraburkholderia]MBB5406332.1 NAD(P)-dependent dehydrogenase (short-subunit alcohol dehydrogenase family) [Paraburkholderia sp. HC6.4b]MBB5448730.1 NAD(P)-dependent dehydrogenase (short-subunit alcohol dehydrogenase family) [Paraburkholderia sp. Kb1A]
MTVAQARLAGKVAYITGAGSGIGRAAAQRFALEGARVVIAEFNEALGLSCADAIQATGGQAFYVNTDVTNEDSVRTSIMAATAHWGRLDVLYNNAGGSTSVDAQVTDCPVDEFWRAIRLDLFGTWVTCKYGIAALMRNGGGSVINSSSVFSLVGTRGKDAYTAAKGGISAITRSMAVEYAPHRIRVNALAPAVTMTERVKSLLQTQPDLLNKTCERQLLGLTEPEEIATMAVWLASDESKTVTGQVIAIDGGMSAS